MKAINGPKSDFVTYCDRHSPNQLRSHRVTAERLAAATPPPAEERKKAAIDRRKTKDILPIIPVHIFHRLINVVNQ